MALRRRKWWQWQMTAPIRWSSAPRQTCLATIESMVKEIDQEVTDVTELRVFRLVNADPSETADQLATLFPDPDHSSRQRQPGFDDAVLHAAAFGSRRAAAPPPPRVTATGRRRWAACWRCRIRAPRRSS